MTKKRKIFELEFDAIAKDYDKIEPVPEYIHKIINKHLPKNRTHLIELGCGTGRLLKELENEFENIIGIDLSKEMIKISKSRLGKKVKLIHSPIEKINFKKKQYDFVVSNAMFHHINKKEIEKLLFSIKNSIKPGGKLFISDFVTHFFLKPRQDWVYYLYVSMGAIKKGKFNFLKEIKKEPKIFRKHIKTERGMFFSKKEFIKIFKKVFPGCKFGCLGGVKDLIKIYYVVWENS